MALTQAAVSSLGAKIVGHDMAGVTLPTGLVKTRVGLIARPSRESGDCRTGKLAGEDTDEDPVQEQASEFVEEQPVRRNARRKARRAQQTTAQAPAAVPQPVRIEYTIPGFGSVPTQVTHVYRGTGVLVLGLNAYSFVPSTAEMGENGELKGVLQVSVEPDRQYVYGGMSFVDAAGIKNIILAEVK